MKTNINKLFILPLILSGLVISQDADNEIAFEPSDIDILLDLVEENTLLRTKTDQERLNQFIRNRNQQQKLLNDAKRLLKLEKDREARLTRNFEDNDAKLSDLEEQLNLKIGTLGETFGVVRQISGDAKSNFSQSLTNLQFPNRICLLYTS